MFNVKKICLLIMLFIFFSNFVAYILNMARVGANVELSGLVVAVAATLAWYHHSNGGRVLTALEKPFSALGNFLFGDDERTRANEKSADEGTSKTKSPDASDRPDFGKGNFPEYVRRGASFYLVDQRKNTDADVFQIKYGNLVANPSQYLSIPPDRPEDEPTGNTFVEASIRHTVKSKEKFARCMERKESPRRTCLLLKRPSNEEEKAFWKLCLQKTKEGFSKIKQ